MNDGVRARLDHAEKLLGGDSLDGAWPRGAVWLIRLALEHQIDALWARRSPALTSCTRRSQLLALGAVLDRETQHRVTSLWTTLSRASHHHPYELSPTVPELRSWLAEARALAAALAAAA